MLQIYKQMLRSRVFEEHVINLWNKGYIFGEMHTSIGEEGIVAGILNHLKEGDALALDHRGTCPSIIRGIDPKSLMLEFLGHKKGLCSGNGGHMHIFSKEKLVASSGIVGSSGPAAAGFALAAKQLNPGNVSVAFFGEGAMNQGMLMESMNFASVLKLPVLFVCKNNEWAITTRSSSVTAGKLADRAKAFKIPAHELNGADVEKVWNVAKIAFTRARSGKGPTFVHATCTRPHMHLLGDPLLRIVNEPLKELKQVAGPLLKSATSSGGAAIQKRLGSLTKITSLIGKTAMGKLFKENDPLLRVKKRLRGEKEKLELISEEVKTEMDTMINEVLKLNEKIKL